MRVVYFVLLVFLAIPQGRSSSFDAGKFKRCLVGELKKLQAEHPGRRLHASVHYYWDSIQKTKILYHQLHVVGTPDSFSRPWVQLFKLDWKACSLDKLFDFDLASFDDYMEDILASGEKYCPLNLEMTESHLVNFPTNYPESHIFQDTYRIEKEGRIWVAHRKQHNEYCGGLNSEVKLRPLKKKIKVSCSKTLNGFCNIDF